MAVIGKIQKNSVLLLIVIGLAMLAFIFTDLIGGGGGSYEVTPTGTIYGETIDEDEYQYLRTTFVDRDRQNALYQNQPYDDTQEKGSEDKAFNEVIRRSLMNREFEALGLICTTDELNDMIHGNHIHPWVMQIPIFNGPLGFSRDSVRNFISQLDVEPLDENAREGWIEGRKQWKEFEDELKDTRKADKYVTLVRRGLFVNTIEAKDAYYANNNKKKIKFVLQRFTDIPMDEFEATDEDIQVYFDEHKEDKQYQQEESRDLDYLFFPIIASEEDMNLVSESVASLLTPFAETEDNISFVKMNSDGDFSSDSSVFHMGTESFIFDQMFGNNQYPISADEAIQKAEIGDVIGPFSSVNMQTGENEIVIAKVTAIERENQAWVRHILIKVDANRTDEVAVALVDSIINVIETNDNFVEMVTAMTEDPGSVASNGEYKWFAEGRMVPEFNDASFNGELGALQIVKTTYGYHIVEVLDRGERVLPSLSCIVKKIEPSENTLIDFEISVFDFIYNISEAENDSAFHRMAVDSGMTVQNSRIWMNNTFVTGLNKADKILRFAFNNDAEEGNISDPILDGDKYVVAYLANIIEEGAPEFEDVKEQMRFPALKEKQAAFYMNEMANKSSLAEVAKVVYNGSILTAEIYFGSNTIQGGGGNEPEVIGKLFTNIPAGSMTHPIKGRTGVYVVIVESETPAIETTDYSAQIGAMTMARMGSADNMVIRALREKADVKDNRRKIELQ